MNKAKNLFEEKAKEFDNIIPLLIPFYNEIYDILIESIPFQKHISIKVLDIGCGTGTLAKTIKQRFPYASITCNDFAKNMIEIARKKLSKYKSDINFLIGDFNKIQPDEKYDVIVSSFALHHIATDNEKIQLYENIYNSLNTNGVFLTADIVLGANNHTESLYLKKWKNFLNINFSENIIEKELLPKYQTDDNPSELFNHLKWLENTGFKEIETIWKYYNFAIFGGRKTG